MKKKWKLIIPALIIIVASSFGCANSAQNSPAAVSQSQPPQVIAEFDISEGPNLVLLPVDLKGKRYRFLLDTGASRTVFDDSLRHLLGSKPVRSEKASVAHGKFIRFDYYNAPDAMIGPIPLKQCGLVAAVDLKPLNRLAKQRVDGVIGMDILKKYCVQIDFDAGKVRFLSQGKKETGRWGEKLHVNFEPGTFIPMVNAKILHNKPVSFMIDTGHLTMLKSGYLEKGVIEEASKYTNSANIQSEIATAAEVKVLNLKHVVLNDLMIGELSYDQTLFSENSESLLGMWFLSQHKVTFDFPAGAMYLKPGNRYGMLNDFTFSLSKCGFGLRRNGKNFVVDSIDPQGPAARLGVKANDVILKIAGLDLARLSMTDIYLMLRSAKEKLTMTLQRDGLTGQVTLALKD